MLGGIIRWMTSGCVSKGMRSDGGCWSMYIAGKDYLVGHSDEVFIDADQMIWGLYIVLTALGG